MANIPTMKSFLHSVANDLYQRFGNNMTRLVVVFPNKRASLFLNKEFISICKEHDNKPIWAPKYQTINDLFQSLSPYNTLDPIVAVCRLYGVYKEVLQSEESIDKFFGWGEVILSDFNDIDKQMVDAEALFKYVKDWNDLTATDFLNEAQLAALKRYFADYGEDIEAKKRFLEMWKALPIIYKEYKKALMSDGQLYDGALCRDVVESNRYSAIDQDKIYVFVGFNILSPVQLRLMRGIKGEIGENVLYYWDYDPAISRSNEGIDMLFNDACSYIRSYQDRLPNALPEGWSEGESFVPKIQYIKTDTSNAQVHYMSSWLKERTDDYTNTAVVLADEALLPQVLFSLPDKPTNITMGYPLSHTPVSSFIHALTDLHTKGLRADRSGFYQYYLRRVETHPIFLLARKSNVLEGWDTPLPQLTGTALLNYLDDIVLKVLSIMEPQLYTQESTIPPYIMMYEEALVQVHNAILRIKELQLPASDCALASRLLDRILHSVSISFHGEPLSGLQVMGVLETRLLDFDNIIILSAIEGTLPKPVTVSSMIPYAFRNPFGLSTEQEQENVYAYNFFRMLRRARQVTLMIPQTGSSSGEGEMSRFMRQILAESNIEPECFQLDFQHHGNSEAIRIEMNAEIEKTPEMIRSLCRMADGTLLPDGSRRRLLSPSALNTYFSCPMRFYYRYIKYIRIEEEITSSLTESQFGTVFHAAAQLFYKEIAPSGEVTADALDKATQKQIEQAVDQAIQQEIFDQTSSDVKSLEGELIIARDVIINYLTRLVAIDKNLAPFRIIQMEGNHSLEMDITAAGHPHTLHIGGSIDRLDLIHRHPLSGHPAIRILDYKTGGKLEDKNQDKELSTLFNRDDKDRKYNVFQTFLYAQAVADEIQRGRLSLQDAHHTDLMPGLMYIRVASDAERYDERIYLQKEPLNRFQTIADQFTSLLKDFLENELLNLEVPFCRTENDKSCAHCDYRLLCNKPIDR